MSNSTWTHKFDVSDVFNNDDLFTASKGVIIADRIRKQSWFGEVNIFGELDDICDGLSEIAEYTGKAFGNEAEEEFDGWWDRFYDLADHYRVWVVTR